jgi:hypothetical protein
MANDLVPLTKFCRKGRQRRPQHHIVGYVEDGKQVKMRSKLGWRSYELAMADHDPADAALYVKAFMRFMADTRSFRQQRSEKAAAYKGQAHCYKAQWLMGNREFTGDECLFFPSMVTGRTEKVKYNYRTIAASRAMLLMTQGLPEDEKAMCTHKCGNGHLSCVNPDHLMWGNAATNGRDASLHNSPREFIEGMEPETVREIYAAPGLVNVLAWQYDIPAAIVSGIKQDELWAGWTGQE